jgi:hypothetical protein
LERARTVDCHEQQVDAMLVLDEGADGVGPRDGMAPSAELLDATLPPSPLFQVGDPEMFAPVHDVPPRTFLPPSPGRAPSRSLASPQVGQALVMTKPFQ